MPPSVLLLGASSHLSWAPRRLGICKFRFILFELPESPSCFFHEKLAVRRKISIGKAEVPSSAWENVGFKSDFIVIIFPMLNCVEVAGGELVH